MKYGLPSTERLDAPAAKALRLPWLLRQLMRREGELGLAHIHISTLDKLAAFLPALARPRRRTRFVATLHHGDQEAVYRNMLPPLRWLSALALRRLDGIVAFTPAQQRLYERLGVPSGRILMASSYIRPPQDLANLQAPIAGLKELKAKGCFLAVASGFATEIYQHELAIEAIDRLRSIREAHLFLCLYGSISKPYLQRLESMAAERPHVSILWGLELPAFLELLGASDVYLRPTAVDSFGIAVADAINQGTPVIASDVCPRYPGAMTYPAGDVGAFQSLLLDLAQRGGGPAPIQLPEDASAQLAQWYDRLLNGTATV